MTTTMRAVVRGLATVAVVASCRSAPSPEATPAKTRAKAEAAKAELTKAEAAPGSEPGAQRQRARKLLLSDPEAAYEEARASHASEPHVDSLWVMGAAACRLRDGERAKLPFEQLEADLRAELVDYCARKGVDLEALVGG